MDVYVIHDETATTEDKKLKIEGITMVHADDQSTVVPKTDGMDPDKDKKTDKFVNEYPTSSLEIDKTVTGNQGSKDQWFEFTIKLTAPAGETIDDNLEIQVTEQVKEPSANDATTYTAAEMTTQNDVATLKWSDLKAGYKVYLQNGSKIKLHGIPENCTYEIVEDNKDYKVSTSKKVGSEDAVTDTGNTVTDTMTEDNTIITYTNNKEGIIPTGVLLSATPWIILGIVLIAGIVFFAVRSKKKYEEE